MVTIDTKTVEAFMLATIFCEVIYNKYLEQKYTHHNPGIYSVPGFLLRLLPETITSSSSFLHLSLCLSLPTFLGLWKGNAKRLVGWIYCIVLSMDWLSPGSALLSLNTWTFTASLFGEELLSGSSSQFFPKDQGFTKDQQFPPCMKMPHPLPPSLPLPSSKEASYGHFFSLDQELPIVLDANITWTFLSTHCFSVFFFPFFSLLSSLFNQTSNTFPRWCLSLELYFPAPIYKVGLMKQLSLHLPTTDLASNLVIATIQTQNFVSSPLFSLHLLIHASHARPLKFWMII